jgi:hypothetical protein
MTSRLKSREIRALLPSPVAPAARRLADTAPSASKEQRRDLWSRPLEVPVGGGHEPASALGLDEVGVGHALGGEQRLGRCQPQFLVADAEARLTLEDVEELVVGVVDVERWRVVTRREILEQAEPVASLLAAPPGCDERVQEPQLRVCDEQR